MELKPGYKQAEVGVIPEDWIIQPIANLVADTSPICYGVVQVGKHSDEGIPIVAIKHVKEIEGATHHMASRATEAPYSRSRVQAGDVLISIKGTIGRIGIVPTGFRGNISRELARLRIREGVCPEFVAFQLEGSSTQDRINQAVVGTTRLEFSIAQLRNFLIALPAVEAEQRAIAEILADIDAKIRLVGRLITKKKRLKQAAMQELLTGKRRLPGFEGEWEVKRLEDIATIDPENLGSNTQPHYRFNYISLEDIDQGSLLNWSELEFLSSPSRARRRLRPSDVLVSTVRPNLKSHLLFSQDNGDWVCSTGFATLRCNGELADPSYIYFHLFDSFINKQIEALLTGSNYPAISSRDVRRLEIPVPALSEQKEIARTLTSMEDEMISLTQRLEKARLLKQGMMQQLLTGKIRLT
jgi:type I restriction enzyme S subunit